MKFYQYINENRTDWSVSLKESINIIKNSCTGILKNYKKSDSRIYRGIDYFSGESGIINPQKHTRESANTQNYYTLLFDYILPSWRKYPDRSKSIVCANNFKNAAAYGEPYVIFPYDGAKIGVCPKEDIWVSFDNIGRLNDFNDNIDSLLAREGFSTSTAEKDPEYLKSSLMEIEKLYNKDPSFKKMIDGYFAPDIIKELFKSGDDIIETLDKLLSPTSNGFKLLKTSDSIPRGNREVWTDAKSIMVNARSVNVEEMIKGI